MATLNLTKDTFQSTVDSNEIVFIDFWADWCAPCRMFGPIFEKVSEKHSDIVFGKINTEAEPELAQTFQVTSIPMLMVIRDQTILFAQPGALQENMLEDLVDQIRKVDMDEIKKKIKEEEAKN